MSVKKHVATCLTWASGLFFLRSLHEYCKVCCGMFIYVTLCNFQIFWKKYPRKISSLQICCELNHSSLRRVREWTGSKGEWRWQVSEEPVGDMAQVSLIKICWLKICIAWEYAFNLGNCSLDVSNVFVTKQGAEYAAFIYNVQHGLQLLSASLLSIQENNGSSFSTKPYLGYFKVRVYL